MIKLTEPKGTDGNAAEVFVPIKVTKEGHPTLSLKQVLEYGDVVTLKILSTEIEQTKGRDFDTGDLVDKDFINVEYNGKPRTLWLTSTSLKSDIKNLETHFAQKGESLLDRVITVSKEKFQGNKTVYNVSVELSDEEKKAYFDDPKGKEFFAKQKAEAAKKAK